MICYACQEVHNRPKRHNAQSPLEAVGSLLELINERGRSLIQIIEGMPLTMIINPSHQYFSVFSSRHVTLRLSTVLIEVGDKPYYPPGSGRRNRIVIPAIL